MNQQTCSESRMTYPHIRKAEPRDYEAMWAIWMQDHIIQWMSFPKQTKEAFREHYMQMEKASDIYVVVDQINEEEKVVAVRRIKFGKDEHQHIAEYCSLGVDKASQGKGYAQFFYEEFEKIARNAGIKRIQLTQSGGNEAAFHIADKRFYEEAMFPDWLKRSNNEGDYYLIERYIYRFLDEELTVIAPKLPTLKYEETFPQIHPQTKNEAITLSRVGHQFICYFQDKALLTVDFDPDDSVIPHIGFLSIQLHSYDNLAEAKQGLNKILTNLAEEGRVKKLELFTPDPAVAKLCQQSGFFVRGEKLASYYKEGEYKNELGVEYSFFNLLDAEKLILAKIPDATKRHSVGEILSKCSKTIEDLIKEDTCDALGARYLENLIYQMVRDNLGPNRIFSLSDKRWMPLLEKTPTVLHDDLLRLSNRLQNSSASFFKTGALVSLEQPKIITNKNEFF